MGFRVRVGNVAYVNKDCSESVGVTDCCKYIPVVVLQHVTTRGLSGLDWHYNVATSDGELFSVDVDKLVTKNEYLKATGQEAAPLEEAVEE